MDFRERVLLALILDQSEDRARQAVGKVHNKPTEDVSDARKRHEAERAARKTSIPVAFKEWAAAQRPQVNQGLRGWEDPEIRRRFEQSRIDNTRRAEADARLGRKP